MSARLRDIMLGFGVAAVFAWLLFIAIPQQIRVPSSVETAALSPAFWPRVTAGLALFMGLLVGIRGVLARGPAAGEPVDGYTRASWVSMAAIAVMFGYYALLDELGIVASSALALPALAWLFGERRLKVLVPLAILLPVGLYYFFTQVANIPLPLGIFDDYF